MAAEARSTLSPRREGAKKKRLPFPRLLCALARCLWIGFDVLAKWRFAAGGLFLGVPAPQRSIPLRHSLLSYEPPSRRGAEDGNSQMIWPNLLADALCSTRHDEESRHSSSGQSAVFWSEPLRTSASPAVSIAAAIRREIHRGGRRGSQMVPHGADAGRVMTWMPAKPTAISLVAISVHCICGPVAKTLPRR